MTNALTRWWKSRGIHRAARSVEPPTVPMLLVKLQTAGAARSPHTVRAYPPRVPPPPAAPAPRCPCGRPTVNPWYPGEPSWCCWVCRAATDGGWQLGSWRPGIHWTATHTWACEQRRLAYAAVVWARSS